MTPGPLLLVPRAGRGYGGGHLARCAVLVRELRSLGREVWIYFPLPEDAGTDPGSDDVFDPRWVLREGRGLREHPWDWIVLDYFRTPRGLFEELAELAPIIAIDEGGPFRRHCDFTLDLLPGFSRGRAPNYFFPALLPLPKNRRPSFSPEPRNRPLRVLISFGAEDPGKLTVPLSLTLLREARKTGESGTGVPDLTAVFGGLYDRDKGASSREAADRRILEAAGIRVLSGIPSLREHLAGYDLLITHFGLGAFEALHAGTPVLLLAPGRLHEKLARRGGFPSAGAGRRGIARLGRMIRRGNRNVRPGEPANPACPPWFAEIHACCAELSRRYRLDEPPSQTLGTLIHGFSLPPARHCPVCGAPIRKHRVLARFPGRTYRRCSRCGMIYLLRTDPPPIEYQGDYFFDFYKRQYGKTYLEDFPHLQELGTLRLSRIRQFLPRAGTPVPPGKALLLDIGCAYGPFLAAAAAEGFAPWGIDPAEDAVRYVGDTLGFPAHRGFFPDLPPEALPEEGTIDVVTLWYVIEHFSKLRKVLGTIRRLLKPGGVLAFSTPSCRGISGRKSLRGFLEKSPPDHWTVWDPQKTRRILTEAGFSLKRIVSTGHHPERFPLAGPFVQYKHRGLYRCTLGVSRLLALGDTFEAYAVKR